MIDFKNKKVVVLGLGKSGFSAAQLLQHLGASVMVSEKKNEQRQKAFAADLKKLSIDCELGVHTKAAIEAADYVVLSPGIPLSSEPVLWAKSKHIEIIGEMELGYQNCPAEIIATTGTNGKTTVTTLIGSVLRAAGRNVFVLGNIGEPLCSRVAEMHTTDIVSLEVSSFQLETIKEFRPRVSVLLNFTPDHLDRYHVLGEYLAAKKRIFSHQGTDDYVVLNEADATLRALAKEARSKVVFFNEQEAGAACGLNANQLAVVKVAEIFGIPFDTCLKVFNNFKGIEHRLELVRDIDGIEFINDSKATNVESTMWALNTISRPIVLIAGGRDKGSDFGTIRSYFKGKVKSLVLIGEATRKISDALASVVETTEAGDMKSAVAIAYHKAQRGDCVLLSPMCASFDMFAHYEERGRKFKEFVQNLPLSL